MISSALSVHVTKASLKSLGVDGSWHRHSIALQQVTEDNVQAFELWCIERGGTGGTLHIYRDFVGPNMQLSRLRLGEISRVHNIHDLVFRQVR